MYVDECHVVRPEHEFAPEKVDSELLLGADHSIHIEFEYAVMALGFSEPLAEKADRVL